MVKKLNTYLQQNLIAQQTDYRLAMSTENKPVVAIYINLLVRVDMEKACGLGLEIAKDTNAIFQGILPWSIPNHDIQYLSFIADMDSTNKIIGKVKLGLDLLDENLLYTITPSSRPIQKPPPIMMAP